MAVKRALAFRAGSGVDATCAACELAWEEGADTLDIRVLRRCAKPPEVEWHGTGLCLGCCAELQGSPDRTVLRPVRRNLE